MREGRKEEQGGCVRGDLKEGGTRKGGERGG